MALSVNNSGMATRTIFLELAEKREPDSNIVSPLDLLLLLFKFKI